MFTHFDTLADAQAAAVAGDILPGSRHRVLERTGFDVVVESADAATNPGGGRIKPVERPIDTRWFGASGEGVNQSPGTALDAARARNRNAIDAAVAFADAEGGAAVFNGKDCEYGRRYNDITTFIDVSGTANDIFVEDLSGGTTFDVYGENDPLDRRDGAQVFRYIQTANAPDGYSNGGGDHILQDHNPYLFIGNTRIIEPVGSASRTAGDAQQASFFLGGVRRIASNTPGEFQYALRPIWQIGTGGGGSSHVGADKDFEQMSPFNIARYQTWQGADTTGTVVFQIDPVTGRMSFGHNAPLAAYHFKSNGPMGSGILHDSDADPFYRIVNRTSGNSGEVALRNASMAIAVNGSNWMTVKDGGDVYVGQATGSLGGFTGQYDKPNGYAAFLFNSSTRGGSTVLGLRSATGNAAQYLIYGLGAGSLTFSVRANGDTANRNNVYAALSDRRLKKDIREAGSQWSDIGNLRLRKYRLRDDDDGLEHLGLVAQEVEEVSPGLVDETAIVLEGETGDGVVEREATTRKTVKYSVLNLKLLGAFQEAQGRIEALESENVRLRKSLQDIDSRLDRLEG